MIRSSKRSAKRVPIRKRILESIRHKAKKDSVLITSVQTYSTDLLYNRIKAECSKKRLRLKDVCKIWTTTSVLKRSECVSDEQYALPSNWSVRYLTKTRTTDSDSVLLSRIRILIKRLKQAKLMIRDNSADTKRNTVDKLILSCLNIEYSKKMADFCTVALQDEGFRMANEAHYYSYKQLAVRLPSVSSREPENS